MNNSWNIRKLGDICTSDLGKTRDEKRNKGSFHPYLCAINVQWDKFELSELKEMRFEDDEYERFTIRKGDLVICEGGDIGRAAIWDQDEAIHYQNALHRVRFIDGIDARFILYYLKYLKHEGILDGRYGKGVTIKHLVKSSLVSIPVPVPSIYEQQRIVDELDLLTGIIDKKNAQLRDLDALAQSIFYEMFGDPVLNEKGWPIKKIGDFCNSELGKMLDSKRASGAKKPYLCTINVLWDNIDLSTQKIMLIKDEELERYSVKKGDLLICEGGDIGRSAIYDLDVEMYYQNSLHRVRFNEEEMCPQYMLHLFKILKERGELNQYGKGQTIQHLVKKALLSIPVPVPDISTQHLFVDKLSAIHENRKIIEKSLASIEILFQSRMNTFFSD